MDIIDLLMVIPIIILLWGVALVFLYLLLLGAYCKISQYDWFNNFKSWCKDKYNNDDCNPENRF